MRSSLSQEVTWPAATRVLSRGKRRNSRSEIVEKWNFSDVPSTCNKYSQKKRSMCEMRNGYKACQISLLYFFVSLFSRTWRCTTFNDIPIILLVFVCLFVVVVFFFTNKKRCLNLFNQFLNRKQRIAHCQGASNLIQINCGTVDLIFCLLSWPVSPAKAANMMGHGWFMPHLHPNVNVSHILSRMYTVTKC